MHTENIRPILESGMTLRDQAADLLDPSDLYIPEENACNAILLRFQRELLNHDIDEVQFALPDGDVLSVFSSVFLTILLASHWTDDYKYSIAYHGVNRETSMVYREHAKLLASVATAKTLRKSSGGDANDISFPTPPQDVLYYTYQSTDHHNHTVTHQTHTKAITHPSHLTNFTFLICGLIEAMPDWKTHPNEKGLIKLNSNTAQLAERVHLVFDKITEYDDIHPTPSTLSSSLSK